jgi:hypothetical protein
MGREQVDFEQVALHEPCLRSGGRLASRRGGRPAPRNPRFKAREQVDLEQAASHEPYLAMSPSPRIGHGSLLAPRGRHETAQGPRPGFQSTHGFRALSGRQGVVPYRPLVQRDLVETIPTRCRPCRAKEYVGGQFPGPCPGLSHPTPLGLVEMPHRCSHPGSRSVGRSVLNRGTSHEP